MRKGHGPTQNRSLPKCWGDTGFHWAAPKTDPKEPEPPQVDYQDGKPVRVWFTGIETPFPADDCIIYEEIVRTQR